MADSCQLFFHLIQVVAAKKQLILALDIGTSSVRAALYDNKGDVVPSTMVKNERLLTSTDDGGAEIDADEACEQVVKAIDDVLAKAEDIEGEITHAASSCFWHSLVGVDAGGRATTKVLGWADTRSRDRTAALRKKFDESAVHNRTGARFHSSYWPAKLYWLRRTDRTSYARTAKWLSLSDLIALRLSGKAVTSVSMASGTGLFDIRKLEWDAELLDFLTLNVKKLPQVSDDAARTFSLDAEFAERWPRLKNTEWFPAISDGAANNIGAGCMHKTQAALMIGTSGAMRVAYKGRPPERIPPGLWCYRIDRRRMIIGGALSDGGGLYRWLKDNLRMLENDDKTEDEIAKRPPAAHGLTFLPFLAGERSTGYHEDATGAILGLRTSTDVIDIVQAALESVAFRFAEIFDRLRRVAGIQDIVASGGALRESPVWTQIIADTLGRDITLPDTHEASSRGAVLLALEAIGTIKDVGLLSTPSGSRFQADKAKRRIYDEARTLHVKVYRALMS